MQSTHTVIGSRSSAVTFVNTEQNNTEYHYKSTQQQEGNSFQNKLKIDKVPSSCSRVVQTSVRRAITSVPQLGRTVFLYQITVQTESQRKFSHCCYINILYSTNKLP
jgi:hypothetical protein